VLRLVPLGQVSSLGLVEESCALHPIG
jgi:hypothetical protein